MERITSDYGKQLRMNRSIQVEGSFADIKADMGFRRYTYRGMENILAQSIILAIAHNINKLHKKIQNDRTVTALVLLKKRTYALSQTGKTKTAFGIGRGEWRFHKRSKVEYQNASRLRLCHRSHACS